MSSRGELTVVALRCFIDEVPFFNDIEFRDIATKIVLRGLKDIGAQLGSLELAIRRTRQRYGEITGQGIAKEDADAC